MPDLVGKLWIASVEPSVDRLLIEIQVLHAECSDGLQPLIWQTKLLGNEVAFLPPELDKGASCQVQHLVDELAANGAELRWLSRHKQRDNQRGSPVFVGEELSYVLAGGLHEVWILDSCPLTVDTAALGGLLAIHGER